MAVSIHPSVDQGVKQGSGNFAGGTLTCKCTQNPVTVAIKGDVAFNHACGCTKCWKPAGATSQSSGSSSVTIFRYGEWAEAQSRRPVRRHSASCLQRLRRAYVRPHREQGASALRLRLHPRRAFQGKGLGCPQFAAFVSSVIESGIKPNQMDGIRARLKELGLEPYDCLSPPLMDLLATDAAKKKALWRPSASAYGFTRVRSHQSAPLVWRRRRLLPPRRRHDGVLDALFPCSRRRRPRKAVCRCCITSQGSPALKRPS